jgi:hypothetical protein
MGGTGVKRVGLPYQKRAPIALGTSDNRRPEAVWHKFRVARPPLGMLQSGLTERWQT